MLLVLLVPWLTMILSCDGSDEGREPNWWARGESEKVCEKSAEERAVDEVRSVVEGKTDCPGDDAGDKSQSQVSPPQPPLGFVRLLLLPQVAIVVIVVAVIACIVACSSAGVQGARGSWKEFIL